MIQSCNTEVYMAPNSIRNKIVNKKPYETETNWYIQNKIKTLIKKYKRYKTSTIMKSKIYNIKGNLIIQN